MVLFAARAHEPEPEETIVLMQPAQAHMVVAVGLADAALFDLLEITKSLLPGAAADGESAVGKIDQHFAALQIVDGDGFERIALGRMRQHQDGKLVLRFEPLKHFHEPERGHAVFGASAYAGDIIEDEH